MVKHVSQKDFEKKIFRHSSKDLVKRVGYNYTTSETNQIKTEMSRRLIEAIEKFNKNSSEQTQKMLTLTKWIIGLTIVLGIFGIIQIAPQITKIFSMIRW